MEASECSKNSTPEMVAISALFPNFPFPPTSFQIMSALLLLLDSDITYLKKNN
jgi:hypothetical protein